MILLKDIYGLEQKVCNFFAKEANQEKSFTILDIAKFVDPKKKIEFTNLFNLLRKLEIEGILYQNDDETWKLFPHKKGYVQCSVSKNRIGEGFINLPDGRKFKIEENEAGPLLNGDLIIIEPTSKRSGNRKMAKLKKIVKRKNGLVAVTVHTDGYMTYLTPQNVVLGGCYIHLPKNVLSQFTEGQELLVKVDKVNKDGDYDATLVDVITPQNREAISKLVSEPTVENQSMEVYKDNKKRIMAEFDYENYTVTGVLEINSYNEGMVVVGNKKYLIKRNKLNEAFDGDTVTIRPSKLKSHGSIVSVVEDIVERKNGLITIEVTQDKKGEVALVPLNYHLNHKIVLPEDCTKVFVAGDRFVGKIDQVNSSGDYEVEFVRNIGHKDDPGADISLIAAAREIVEPFTDEQMAEAKSLPTEVSEEETKGRDDYRKVKVFSIDGAKTKDRDDAMSIERLENGNFKVGVHIADVTHYVHLGMALWQAILDRATSVYMDDTVIPMLPHIISNGICSLNPGVDRLTLSCIMEISPDGEVVNYDFKDCVIKSRMAMVYDDVNELLEHNNVVEGYEDFTTELKDLHMLSKKLSKKRMENGGINFDDIESDVEVERDKDGNPIEFTSKRQGAAEKLIENFMLLAGRCYADYMVVPTTLRVHEEPDEDRVMDAVKTIKKLGVKVKKVESVANGKTLQKIISSIKDKSTRTVAANIILRSMKRARIDVDEEIGHYALAERKIGRFTSPIRRAEDAIGHWQLKKQRDGLYDNKTFDATISAEYDELKKESEYITHKQVMADLAEKDAIFLRMTDYIKPRIGEEFAAQVTYINETGIFIKTANGVVGKISPEDYEDDEIIYDDNTLSFRPKHGGPNIKIGSLLKVVALSTDREYHTINFGVEDTHVKRLVYRNRHKKSA